MTLHINAYFLKKLEKGFDGHQWLSTNYFQWKSVPNEITHKIMALSILRITTEAWLTLSVLPQEHWVMKHETFQEAVQSIR